MAEVKNSFLKSKMNKDLDDRLIPNGEYRNAENISIGKSESSDVGAIEDILGNSLIDITNLPEGEEVIGVYADISNERLITFIKGTESSEDSIKMFDLNASSSYQTLVSGNFLNFNASNKIISINLIEDLLFWTDNYNQPRKINVQRAIDNNNYYLTEHSISVAKYAPYESIKMYKETSAKVIGFDEVLIQVEKNNALAVGMTVVNDTIPASEYIKIKSLDQSDANFTLVEFYDNPSTAVEVGDTLFCLISTMTDGTENDTNPNWPGDPDYLEDKMVRFSYRFKFDDNEYSIFAPFTQIGFIPKQKGYFGTGQEQATYSSTIVGFFENLINDIKLIIPLPCLGNRLLTDYKIKAIDILYKESDGLAIRVVDTISSSDISANNPSDTFYEYDYQSRKPIKTVPSNQTVRVYDKVPVKAKAQEITGNRVIYANFQDKHTPPANLSYNVRADGKLASQYFTDFVELPNHTLKQNRNYQVGFILSDKYGRSSSVILSSVDEGLSNSLGFFKGSTVYSGYYKDYTDIEEGVDGWFGDSLTLQLNQAIASTKSNSTGEPGLYAENAVAFTVSEVFIDNNPGTYNALEYEYQGGGVPAPGQSLRGEYIDYVKIISVTPSIDPISPPPLGTTIILETDANGGEINTDIYSANPLVGDGPDIKYSYNINPLGWYSYKVVVKQTEQDYYNVYLPSVLSGPITSGTADPAATTSYITLINDNINKVPRDLSEVGPDQKQYRSSVRLYGRVESKYTSAGQGEYFNTQYFPGREASTSDIVSEFDNLIDQTTGHTAGEIYQSLTNPILARVTSTAPFGIEAGDFDTSEDRFQLAVYETEPTVSAIDIYWESSSSGLISDLNYDVLTGFDGAVGFEDPEFDFIEERSIDEVLTAEWFGALNNVGATISNIAVQSFTVTSGRGDVTNDFSINQNTDTGSNDFGKFQIALNTQYQFLYDSPENDVFTFDITLAVGTDISVLTLGPYPLKNATPGLENAPEDFYQFDETQSSTSPIVTFTPAFNGGDAFNADGLTWEIDLGTNNQYNYFSIDPDTGELFVNDAVNLPTSSYQCRLNLWDATNNNNLIEGSGDGTNVLKSLKRSYDFLLIKGIAPTGLTPTTADELLMEWGDVCGNDEPSTNYNYEMSKVVVRYYMSDNPNFTDTINFNGAEWDVDAQAQNNLDFNAAIRQGQTNPSNTVPTKLSGALHQGEFLLEVSSEWGSADSNLINEGIAWLKVYWRSFEDKSDPNAWVEKTDFSGSWLTTSENAMRNALGNFTPRKNYQYQAHNRPGEYYIEVHMQGDTNEPSGEDEDWYCGMPAGTDPEFLTFASQLRLYDLHYLGGGGTQKRKYRHRVNLTGTTVSNPTFWNSNFQYYSDNPFPHYTDRYYTDIDLTNVHTFNQAGLFYNAGVPAITQTNYLYALKGDIDGSIIRNAGDSNTQGTLSCSTQRGSFGIPSSISNYRTDTNYEYIIDLDV